jgi:hypothetical protein
MFAFAENSGLRPPKLDRELKGYFIKCKDTKKLAIAFSLLKAMASEGGAGGIRTLVQTSNYNAFYMFSFHLDFRPLAGRKLPTHSLALIELHRHIKAL